MELNIDSLTETRGVRYAALVKLSGETVDIVGEEEFDSQLVVQALAALNQIEKSLEATKWNDLLIDLENGPVLFTPVGNELLLTAFDEVASLGRIRFAVKRVLAAASS